MGRRRSVGVRSLALQAIVLAVAAGLLAWVVHNTTLNLAARHVASGFAFLWDTAGFSISEGFVPYTARSSYAMAFAVGIVNTLRAAVPAVIFASLIGLALGIAQISRHVLVRLISRALVDLLRNVPLLVQLLAWYVGFLELLPKAKDAPNLNNLLILSNGGLAFAKPLISTGVVFALILASLAAVALAWIFGRRRLWIIGLAVLFVIVMWVVVPGGWDRPQVGLFGITGGASISVEWMSLVCALTLYSGVYCAEIVRAGLLAVDKGQLEAAHALSFTRAQRLRRIILPQSLRVIVPPYTSLVMNTLKNSSLAVAVGYPDIVSIGTTSLNQTGQAIECVALIAAVYLTFNMITAGVMGWVNARVQIRER
jgi:general L-amino acid transport system permease protein